MSLRTQRQVMQRITITKSMRHSCVRYAHPSCMGTRLLFLLSLLSPSAHNQGFHAVTPVSQKHDPMARDGQLSG